MTGRSDGRLLVALGCAVAALTLCGGCMYPQLTEQEASERADRYISELVAALPVEPRLDRAHSGFTLCSGPESHPDTYREYRQVNRSYWLRDLPSEPDAAVFDAAVTYWLAHGFHVTADGRTSGGSGSDVLVKNTADGFAMSLNSPSGGPVTLSVSSPCQRYPGYVDR